MQYINPSEMMAIDINSSFYGVGFEELMENAGRAVYGELKKIPSLKNKKISLLCGTGNNGGDALVAARYLYKDGFKVSAYLIGKKENIKTEEARKALYNLEKAGLPVIELTDPEEIDYITDAIVDGLLGTGIVGEPREPFASVIKKLNSSKAYKVSIDIPSGLGSKTAVNSDLVISLHRSKKGTEQLRTVVKDIGIPSKAETHFGPGNLILNLKRDPSSHKGDNGRVMIVGGSLEYHGAPILAGLGALGAGCDLVTLAVPEVNFEATRSQLPDFIVKKYPGDSLNMDASEKILELTNEMDVCILGPGMGTSGETQKALNSIIEKLSIPAVLDADSLKIVDLNVLKKSAGVITPHSSEFEALTGEKLPKELESRARCVMKWAKKLSVTTLSKGRVDMIADADRVRLNDTGNPGMTAGGTGDVLAGVVAGFISQGMPLFEACGCAAFVNGLAGDALYGFKGYGFTASDVAGELPYTIKRIIDLYRPKRT